MEIPVTLVPSIDAQAWPNEIYVGYATGWMRRYDQEFDPDNPAPQKLQPYLTDAKTLVQKLLADYKEATAAPQTELIDQADRQRDALIAQISTMIEAMLKMTLMPQKQQAAQTLKTGWDIYKPTAKAALRDESTQVQQWLEYVHAHAAQGAALAELGLTQIVADLEQQNDEVIRLMDERAAERQQQKTIVLADDRRMADRAMKSCDRVLNALAILDDDPQRFAVLINALTADQTEWRQRYDDNRRANKRVSVKSDVVGNHLYQTARDWTWARLIEDGKALLAIDPDQPTRILSTDKKAQKAGGLCLALKGVPVKPTDDVGRRGRGQGVPAHPPRQFINIIFYINKLNFQVMFKTRFISMLVLLAAVATGAVAQNYKVSVKEGTEDATSWTIAPAEATTAGVAAGTTVTATYSGTKRVKSVKAVKKAPAGTPLDNTTTAWTAGTFAVPAGHHRERRRDADADRRRDAHPEQGHQPCQRCNAHHPGQWRDGSQRHEQQHRFHRCRQHRNTDTDQRHADSHRRQRR